MSEQPTWERIESALRTRYRDRYRNQVEAVDWAARQYLASLDAPAPSDCHVYKNIYGVWRFACSFKTEQDANAMLAKYAPAPSAEPEFATRSEGSPKDGTREPPPDNKSAYQSILNAHEFYYGKLRALLPSHAPLLAQNAMLKARIEHWEKTADHHWSARQKLQRELNVVTELYNAGRGAEARVKELEEGWHLCHAEGKLTDPIAVHINMLRGTIAKPSVKNIIHLYGREALLKELCEDAQTKNALPQPLS